MAHRDPRLPLTALQLATFATLLRSVAFDRWITVAASMALLVATYAAQRGRTWGVALSFALGITFLGLVALGVAPLWFALVGLLAVRPFVGMFPLFARFDRGAAATLAALATGIGAVGAVLWKEYALALFTMFPLLNPSRYPHHGLAVLSLFAAGIVGRRLLTRTANSAGAASDAAPMDPARIRVADSHEATDAAAYEELESELHTERSRSATGR